jgi:hypothetical protein
VAKVFETEAVSCDANHGTSSTVLIGGMDPQTDGLERRLRTCVESKMYGLWFCTRRLRGLTSAQH